ncbi:MAG: hypothetical protein SF069_00725 [Phycisphaerae bacterium]|nr:hypothetical protein [Phycisphaerae bacterium]
MRTFQRSIFPIATVALSIGAAIAVGCGMPLGNNTDAQNSAAQLVAGSNVDAADAGSLNGLIALGAPDDAGEPGMHPGRGHRGGRGEFGPGQRGGGPGHFGARLAERLGLTDEQKTQARAIFEAAKTQADTLRQTAVTNTRALLTTEQIATLDAALDRARSRMEQALVEGRPPHPGHRAVGVRKLMNDLNLTDEQRTAIGDVRSELRTALRALRDTTKTQFEAILTEEQRQLLETLRQNRPRHRGPGGPPRAEGEMDGADDMPPPPDEVEMIAHELALADE